MPEPELIPEPEPAAEIIPEPVIAPAGAHKHYCTGHKSMWICADGKCKEAEWIGPYLWGL